MSLGGAGAGPAVGLPEVLSLAFSEDGSVFSCGSTKGFKTYKTDTTKVVHAGPVFAGGGASIAQVLTGTGFTALVGDGASTLYPTNKVLIWNEANCKFVIELDFKVQVLNLKFRKDFLVVVTLNEVQVFSFDETLKSRPAKLTSHDTGNNPQGLCAISESTRDLVMAFPVTEEGSLQVTNVKAGGGVIVAAHTNSLSCFNFNKDGTLIVTASTKGTCIRIFNAASGELVRELRRGIEPSTIRSMSFYTDSSRLLVSSEKKTGGTVHVFTLDSDDSHQNKHSKLFSFRSLLPSVFSSEWSFCQFHLEDRRSICAFGRDKDTFVVVGFQGTIYTCVIDSTSKHNCKLLTTGDFL